MHLPQRLLQGRLLAFEILPHFGTSFRFCHRKSARHAPAQPDREMPVSSTVARPILIEEWKKLIDSHPGARQLGRHRTEVAPPLIVIGLSFPDLLSKSLFGLMLVIDGSVGVLGILPDPAVDLIEPIQLIVTVFLRKPAPEVGPVL